MEIEESLIWNREALSRSQNLFLACQEIDYLVAFSVLFKELEPLKPLETKLQRKNQYISYACYMIDEVLNHFKDFEKSIKKEFKG